MAGGRKPKYTEWLEPDGLIRIQGWARDGLTDEQIAHNMGIATGTLYEYKKQFSEITDAIKNGKEVVDRMVENALFKKSQGYSYIETKREIDSDGKVKETTTRKEVPPDTTAQIFWLKNRKPDEWRDRRITEITGKDGGAIEVESPAERIERRIARLAERLGENEDTQGM